MFGLDLDLPDQHDASVLAALADRQRRPLAREPVAVVVAHPDDETIGCGALLARLPGVVLVHVTDGSPRDGIDATREGFATIGAYAAARRLELDAALERGGVLFGELVHLDLPDKEAMRHLPLIVEELASLFEARGTRTVLTHSFEGGHPDHDACAFAVAQAARRIGGMTVIEMPLYRLGAAGMVTQSFVPAAGSPIVTVRLSAAERGVKRAMLDAFATQAELLAPFSLAAERFRLAPSAVDFTRPPNNGRVLYEAFGWHLTAQDWCAEARAALGGLAREAGPRRRAASEPQPWL